MRWLLLLTQPTFKEGVSLWLMDRANWPIAGPCCLGRIVDKERWGAWAVPELCKGPILQNAGWPDTALLHVGSEGMGVI